MFAKFKKFVSLVTLISLVVFLEPGISLALDTSSANFLTGGYQSNLINDSSFTDISSMSVAEIQAFLILKGSVLQNYSEGGKSAAQIIYDAAHGAYPAAVGDWKGININANTGTVSPRIILTYLEKEQGLISKSSAGQDTLDCAMGYEYGQGCASMFQNYPSLRGFANQVGNGAWQLRYDFEYAKRGTKPSDATTHFIVGETDSLSDQTFTTNYTITMTNAATAAIYSYTPYVFDSAYNFWKIFNNWFTASAEVAVVSVNDVTVYSEQTYGTNTTVGGTKTADAKVYFNGQLIQDTGTKWQLTFAADMGKKDYIIEYKDAAGTVIATKTLSVERHATADINGDGKVDLQDLSNMATYWGQNKPGNQLTDLNGDGVVDILDLSLLASNWNG